MELRQLRYFLAVARTLNFTRAAEEVHIAQPPLSRQISQLEEELGVRLLDRDARPLALTEAGHLVREQASEILARLDRLKADVHAMAHGHRRPFRIGLEVSLLYGRIPKIIKVMRAHLPAIEFDLVELRSRDQINALKAREIDVAFTHNALRDHEVEHRVLREERLCVAFAPGSVLDDGNEQPVPVTAIADQRMIFYREDNGAGRLDPGHDLLARHGVFPASAREIRDLQAALGLVAAECGICIVPESVRRMRGEDVRYRTIAEADAVTPIFLSHLREGTSEAIRHVFRAIEELGSGSLEDRPEENARSVAVG